MRGLRFFIAAPFVFAASTLWAQAPIWLVSCSNQANGNVLVCEATQSIVLAENNRRLATLRFLKEAGASEALAAVTLPLGLFLPAGVSLAAGETGLGNAQIESCDAEGCYAALRLAEGWDSALTGQEALTVQGQTQDGEPITFSFALEGFATSWGLIP